MQYAYILAFTSRLPLWHGPPSLHHCYNPYALMGDAPGAKCNQCKLYENDMLPRCAICTYRYPPLIPTIIATQQQDTPVSAAPNQLHICNQSAVHTILY